MNTRTVAINEHARLAKGKAISPKAIAFTDEDIIQREMKVYEQNKAEYLTKFEGKYIAMLNGAVLDSDPDFSKLATRVYKKSGYQAIYMPLVTRREKPYKISSPKLTSNKTV
jgi:hypothetical protein